MALFNYWTSESSLYFTCTAGCHSEKNSYERLNINFYISGKHGRFSLRQKHDYSYFSFLRKFPETVNSQNDQGLFFCFTGNWPPWYGCAVLVAKRQSIIWCQATFCFSLPLRCFDQTLRKSVKSINHTADLLFSTMWLWYARELNLIANSPCRLTVTSVQKKSKKKTGFTKLRAIEQILVFLT